MIRTIHKIRKVRPSCPVMKAVAAHYGVAVDATINEAVDESAGDDAIAIETTTEQEKTYMAQHMNGRVIEDDPTSKWELGEIIGQGGFSTIYKSRCKRNGAFAAIKTVCCCDDTTEMFRNEIEILKKLKHKNIVNIMEAYEFDAQLWMVIEYCEAGSLDDIMYQTNRPLEEIYIQHVIKQVLKALIYLNEVRYIIHRDLKAANILLNKQGQVKLSDFGVSTINHSLKQKKSTFTGSPNWISPEVIEKNASKNRRVYDFRVDIWSLGITAIELAEIEPPYSNLEPDKAMEMILKCDPPKLKQPELWSPDFVAFVNTCLRKNSNERPLPHVLFQHPFIKKESNKEHLMLTFLRERRPDLFKPVNNSNSNSMISHLDEANLVDKISLSSLSSSLTVQSQIKSRNQSTTKSESFLNDIFHLKFPRRQSHQTPSDISSHRNLSLNDSLYLKTNKNPSFVSMPAKNRTSQISNTSSGYKSESSEEEKRNSVSNQGNQDNFKHSNKVETSKSESNLHKSHRNRSFQKMNLVS